MAADQLGFDLGDDVEARAVFCDDRFRYELYRRRGLGPVPEWSMVVFSLCRRYRYELIRRWGVEPVLEWTMLNPSTADAQRNDPTVLRCVSFAKAWGYGGIRVTNLFAWRSPYPRELFVVDDPVGPENYRFLGMAFGPVTVCAWGTDRAVTEMWSREHDGITARPNLMCLGYTADGSPKHPLYLPKGAALRPWPEPEGVNQ